MARSRRKTDRLLSTHHVTGIISPRLETDSTGAPTWIHTPLPDQDVVIRIRTDYLKYIASRAARNKSRMSTYGPLTAYVGHPRPMEVPLLRSEDTPS